MTPFHVTLVPFRNFYAPADLVRGLDSRIWGSVA